MPHENNDYHEDFTPHKQHQADAKDVFIVIVFIMMMLQILPTILGYQPTEVTEAKHEVIVAR